MAVIDGTVKKVRTIEEEYENELITITNGDHESDSKLTVEIDHLDGTAWVRLTGTKFFLTAEDRYELGCVLCAPNVAEGVK